jgi:hypothetical protein
MAALRATRALALTRPTLLYPLSFRTTPAGARAFSQSVTKKSGGGHESHFDPPSGWLWGVKPGEKYEKEGWEGIWYYGFFGCMAFLVVGYAFKPDTR